MFTTPKVHYLILCPISASEVDVPFTAKPSRQFYEKLGDQLVNELIDLINTVDLTYKNELTEQNEASRADRLQETTRVMGAELRSLRTHVESGVRDLKAEIAAARADIIKWMFVFVVGTGITVVGLTVRLLQ